MTFQIDFVVLNLCEIIVVSGKLRISVIPFET